MKRHVDFKVWIDRPVESVDVGTVLTTGRGMKLKVKEIFTVNKQRVFSTDKYGLIYEDELIGPRF